jgi:hypothetical protein
MTVIKLLDLKIGRFSRGKRGEDGKIKENWSKLVEDAKILDPVSSLLNFTLSFTLLKIKHESVNGRPFQMVRQQVIKTASHRSRKSSNLHKLYQLIKKPETCRFNVWAAASHL